MGIGLCLTNSLGTSKSERVIKTERPVDLIAQAGSGTPHRQSRREYTPPLSWYGPRMQLGGHFP